LHLCARIKQKADDLNLFKQRFRKIQWSIAQRRGRTPHVSFAREENWTVRTNDQFIGPKLYVRGEFEFRHFLHAVSLLQRPHIGRLFDLGANIGPIAIPAVARGYANKAAAFEPDPHNFALLVLNVIANDLSERISVFQFALGAETGHGQLLIDSNNFGDYRLDVRENTDLLQDSVAIYDFDSLGIPVDADQDLIYIDVQGHEIEVLRGMQLARQEGTPLVIEFWPQVLASKYQFWDLAELLSSYSYFANLSNFGELTPISELQALWNNYLDRESCDVLFTKSARFCRA